MSKTKILMFLLEKYFDDVQKEVFFCKVVKNKSSGEIKDILKFCFGIDISSYRILALQKRLKDKMKKILFLAQNRKFYLPLLKKKLTRKQLKMLDLYLKYDTNVRLKQHLKVSVVSVSNLRNRIIKKIEKLKLQVDGKSKKCLSVLLSLLYRKNKKEEDFYEI